MGKIKNKGSRDSYKSAPHARLSSTSIQPINMNGVDLSKMTKQQLIDMLLGHQPKTASVSQTGSVNKPKSLVQLTAEKIEKSIKQPAKPIKQSDKLPTLKTLAANAMVKDKIKSSITTVIACLAMFLCCIQVFVAFLYSILLVNS